MPVSSTRSSTTSACCSSLPRNAIRTRYLHLQQSDDAVNHGEWIPCSLRWRQTAQGFEGSAWSSTLSGICWRYM
jgi:hypothetical protein